MCRQLQKTNSIMNLSGTKSSISAPRTVGNGNLRANIILFVSVLLEHKVFVEHIFGLVICPWHPFKTFAIQ